MPNICQHKELLHLSIRVYEKKLPKIMPVLREGNTSLRHLPEKCLQFYVNHIQYITELRDTNACRISHNHAMQNCITNKLLAFCLLASGQLTCLIYRQCIQFQSDHWLKTRPGLLFKNYSFFKMCCSIFSSFNFHFTQQGGNAFIAFRFCEDVLHR